MRKVAVFGNAGAAGKNHKAGQAFFPLPFFSFLSSSLIRLLQIQVASRQRGEI